MRFTEEDVVRHRLVQSIIRAYDRHRPPPDLGGEDGSGGA
jgi:phosphate starvation-inducible protein PhoH